jgi:hypothetical protein
MQFREKGDQIGRIFVQWTIVNFGQVHILKNTQVARIFGYFFADKIMP